VLTRDESFEVKGRTKVLHSVEEVIALSKTCDVFVIGGGEIYKQLIDHADRLLITHVHTIDLEARVFFPDFFDLDVWDLDVDSMVKNEPDKRHAHAFTFATYTRKKQN
jgi:dihydrofolate reductase